MAAPTFGAAGTGQVGTTSGQETTCTVTAIAGELILLHIVVDGIQTSVPSFVAANSDNIEDLAGTDDTMTQVPGSGTNGYHDVGNPVAAGQIIYLGRAIADGTVTVAFTYPSSDDRYSRLYRFRDVAAGTTLADVIENGSAGSSANGAGTSTSVLDTAVTTLGADRLALNLVGINDDLTGLAAFAGESGGDWTLATAIYETGTGNDATLGLMIATIAAAGTIDGGSDTITSDGWGVVGFALKPSAAPVPPPRTQGRYGY